MNESRLVIIGYGMGAHHARLIQEVAALRLHGVCDVDAAKLERAAKEHEGIELYSNYSDVLADPEVDCVIIVTPHNTHAAMAIAAMDAGKHTITDKAMCLTVKEAREMIAARDRNRVILSTFHNRRWDSDFLTVRKAIEDGLIGRIYHIQSCVTGFSKLGGWRTNREAMGGWLFDWGSHTLDQILILAQSRPKHVYAFSHHRFDEPETVEDYVNCTVTFESGLTATTIIGYINKIQMPRWYVIGDKGALHVEDFEKEVYVKTAEEDLTIPLIQGHWKSYYENIADVLAGRGEPAVKPEELVPQIAIAEAAYRSIESEQVAVVEFEC